MVYKWKTEGLFKVKAQDAGEEVERISKENNGANPTIIVSESRPEEAILHECFEWNDKVAAEKHREQQARILVGNLVTVKIVQQEEEPVRAFVNVVTKDSGKQYVTIDTAIAKEEYRQQLLEQAMRDANVFREKYKYIQELSKIIQSIDETFSGVA